jgi:hypothetical protein
LAPNVRICREVTVVADQLGWPDRLDAEYVALTHLQADAFITLNGQLAEAVKDPVTVAPIETLS